MHWWVRVLSCKPTINVSWSTSELRVRLARRETSLSPPVKLFTDHSKAVLLLWIIYVISVLFLLCFCARLFIDALLSPAGKGWPLGSRLWCPIVKLSRTFPLVSGVRCGAWLYRFLIFALFLTLLLFQHYNHYFSPSICPCSVSENTHNSWTKWYIEHILHTNAYKHYLTSATCNIFFDGRWFAEHFSRLWSVSENAHNS